jgi:hypothetical protein
MAATILFWLNLSLSAAHTTSYGLHLAAEPQSLDAATQQIRDLVPEIPEPDARRYAAVLSAGSKLIEAPHVGADPRKQDAARGLADLLPKGE